MPPLSWGSAAGERETMTVPTHTLLKQLKGEVRWWKDGIFENYFLEPKTPHQDQIDHAEAALEIIDELEGRDESDGIENWNNGARWAFSCLEDNLRRLHDLIKGSASREAMDLIRGMIGGE
jgi:hypothetical protein